MLLQLTGVTGVRHISGASTDDPALPVSFTMCITGRKGYYLLSGASGKITKGLCAKGTFSEITLFIVFQPQRD